MGILTDFIIAKEEEKEDILKTEIPSLKWDCLQLKGIDTIKLETLYNIINSKAPYSKIGYDFKLMEGCSDAGPWLFKIPEIMTKSLSEIKASKIENHASIWIKTEELGASYEKDVASEVIIFLREHARKTIALNSVLYLWISL